MYVEEFHEEIKRYCNTSIVLYNVRYPGAREGPDS